MGLRQLFVIPDQPRVLGVLTRKDLTKDNATLVLGEHVNKEENNFNKEFSKYHFSSLAYRLEGLLDLQSWLIVIGIMT